MRRFSTENGAGQAWWESSFVLLYTRILHPILPHAPSSHDPTQAGTRLPTSSSHLKAVPPSIERSFQVHLTQRTIQRGHANNSTLTKCPLDRPTFTRFHQSPPKPPQATPQVKVNSPPYSRRSPSTSIAPPSPAPTRPPREDLDSYHVRAIYAALDVPGVRGTNMKTARSYEGGERPGCRLLLSLDRLPLTFENGPRE